MNLNKRTTLVRSNNSSSKQQKQRKYFRTISIKITLLVIVAIVALAAWVHFCFLFRHDGHYIHDPSLLSDPPPPLHPNPPRYVTVILPSVVNPSGRRKRLESIAQTWGPAARAVYILHSQDEYDIGSGSDSGSAIDANGAYPQTMLLPESITVKDGVPRLEYVLQAILERYDPDFTFFVNDHTYVLPHNACRFLRDRNPEEHLYAGHALSNSQKLAFNSGAAGYFLSRSSLSGLVKRLTAGEEHCSVGSKGEKASGWLQGNPGLVTAKCLGMGMGVGPVDTRDKVGRDLFHAYGLVRTVKGSVDQWYMNKHERLDEILGADPLYHHRPRSGEQSPDTISFHYVESAETVILTDILNKINVAEKPSSSSGKSLSNDELKDYMISIWPTNVGGYSQGLPPIKGMDTWDDLLLTVRNISLGAMCTPCFV